MSQEFVVRVPRETKKQFNVLHFNHALNIDVTKFKNCKMARETLVKDVKEESEGALPEFGEGSEFGRKERDEAKRRKYERRKKQLNNAPWILKVGGKQGKKYKGIREGGVTENTAYYVFFQAPDGAFEAFPVNEWFKFTPFQRFKTLSAEEAEEKFNKRDQILNYFQLKHLPAGKKDNEGFAGEPKIKTERSIKKEFKVSDMDDWYNSDNDNLSDENNSADEDEKPKKAKGKKDKKKKKPKRKNTDDSDNDDEEPGEDSDEGDYDDKEVDYMSDSSSSSESDNENGDIKGVIDESALRDLIVSDDEEEENKEQQNLEQNDDNKPNDEEKKVKNDENDSESGSDFDSDNPDDLDVAKSALLIQSRKTSKIKTDRVESTEAATNEAKPANGNGATASNENNNGSSHELKFKHKLDNPGTSGHVHKRQRVADRSKNELIESLTEDVRRYLLRKPHTIFELLKMARNKVNKSNNNKEIAEKFKLGDIMGEILQKLKPEKRKDHNNKMTFFLRP